MRSTILLGVILTLSGALWAREAPQNQRANHYIDHVVLAIDNLDRGIEEFERMTGVKPRFDGRNARLGTQSAIVGLGGNAFLQIVAPDPRANPRLVDAELRRQNLDRLSEFETLTPFRWAIGTQNLHRTRLFAERARNRTTEPAQGERKRGWGRSVEWTWARVDRPDYFAAPLFIQWAQDGKRPQDRAPEGCELTYLQANTRTFKSLQGLVAAMQVDAEVTGAEEESLNFSLDCPRGEVVFEAIPLTKSYRPK